MLPQWSDVSPYKMLTPQHSLVVLLCTYVEKVQVRVVSLCMKIVCRKEMYIYIMSFIHSESPSCNILDMSINEVSERVTQLATEVEVLLVLITVRDSLPISVGVMMSKFNAKSASVIGEGTSNNLLSKSMGSVAMVDDVVAIVDAMAVVVDTVVVMMGTIGVSSCRKGLRGCCAGHGSCRDGLGSGCGGYSCRVGGLDGWMNCTAMCRHLDNGTLMLLFLRL